MRFGSSKLRRHQKTIAAMIDIYCRRQHGAKGLCPDCTALLSYAQTRLSNCPFAESKPACAKCPVHCYQPDMRKNIRSVMRYAGPRMVFRHPILAFGHFLDNRKTTGMNQRRAK